MITGTGPSLSHFSTPFLGYAAQLLISSDLLLTAANAPYHVGDIIFVIAVDRQQCKVVYFMSPSQKPMNPFIKRSLVINFTAVCFLIQFKFFRKINCPSNSQTTLRSADLLQFARF